MNWHLVWALAWIGGAAVIFTACLLVWLEDRGRRRRIARAKARERGEW